MRSLTTIAMLAAMLAFPASAVGPAKPMKPASPAKAPSATEFFRQGFDAYQAFKCEDALRLFAKGVAQSPDPKAYYFIGNCERWRANRTAAEDAYDRGLKLAPQDSPVRADLESAKASLAVAFDPVLQTKLFYEAARRAGIEPPEGLQAAIDPRLVPVHLDWEWEAKTTSVMSGCPYGADGQYNSRTTGGITTAMYESRCHDPEKLQTVKLVNGFGLYASITDSKWDQQKRKGRTQYRDAQGWKYARGTTSISSRITPSQAGWIEYQEITSTSVSDSNSEVDYSNVMRCQYKSSTDAEIRRLSDGPQLESLCATKLSGDDVLQSTTYIDLITGQELESRYKLAGGQLTRQISGHIGKVGETLTRVDTRNYGSSSAITTQHLTRTR